MDPSGQTTYAGRFSNYPPIMRGIAAAVVSGDRPFKDPRDLGLAIGAVFSTGECRASPETFEMIISGMREGYAMPLETGGHVDNDTDTPALHTDKELASAESPALTPDQELATVILNALADTPVTLDTDPDFSALGLAAPPTATELRRPAFFKKLLGLSDAEWDAVLAVMRDLELELEQHKPERGATDPVKPQRPSRAHHILQHRDQTLLAALYRRQDALAAGILLRRLFWNLAGARFPEAVTRRLLRA